MHPCQRIYNLGANGQRYGEVAGMCRITGESGVGLPFHKWVKDTFTDHGYLKPGDIICNEALFTFDEASETLRIKQGRDKPQRFRTYSHIVAGGQWHCFTKADKRTIYALLTEATPEIVCLSESGQRHLLFKHKPGFWQLEDSHVPADKAKLIHLHGLCRTLLNLGFSQTEVITGEYQAQRIAKAGYSVWLELDTQLEPHRNTSFFDFVTFLLFADYDGTTNS